MTDSATPNAGESQDSPTASQIADAVWDAPIQSHVMPTLSARIYDEKPRRRFRWSRRTEEIVGRLIGTALIVAPAAALYWAIVWLTGWQAW